MGETQVFEIYDPRTGETFGVAPTRYQAAKTARELGARVRRVWVRTIITNDQASFGKCKTR